jgi:hypothetical protein
MVTATRNDPQAVPDGNAVPTAEQLRRVALARAQSRGRWVAGRRLLGRQIWHVLWTLVFPVLGLLTSLVLVLAPALFYFGQGRISISLPWLNPSIASIQSGQHADGRAVFPLKLDRELSEPPLSRPDKAVPQTK